MKVNKHKHIPEHEEPEVEVDINSIAIKYINSNIEQESES